MLGRGELRETNEGRTAHGHALMPARATLVGSREENSKWSRPSRESGAGSVPKTALRSKTLLSQTYAIRLQPYQQCRNYQRTTCLVGVCADAQYSVPGRLGRQFLTFLNEPIRPCTSAQSTACASRPALRGTRPARQRSPGCCCLPWWCGGMSPQGSRRSMRS